MSFAENLGAGGAALNARYGSSLGPNTNAPKLVNADDGNAVYLPGSAGNYVSVPYADSMSLLGVEAERFITFNGLSGHRALVADAPPLRVTGDVEFQIRARCPDWTPTLTGTFFGRWATANLSYGVALASTGVVTFVMSSTGSNSFSGSSTVSVPFVDGSAGWIRVTRVAATGVTSFFTAPDSPSIPTTWTPLGATVTVAAGSNIFAGTAFMEIGGQNVSNALRHDLYRLRILNGIAGTPVFDANVATLPIGTTVFTDQSASQLSVSLTGLTTRIVDGTTALFLPGVSGSYASTPDSAALDILGTEGTKFLALPALTGNGASTPGIAGFNPSGASSIRFEMDVALDNWSPVVATMLHLAGDNFLFSVAAGSLLASYYDSTNVLFNATSTTTIPVSSGQRLRVACNITSAGVVSFFTASVGGAWVQLGTNVSTGSSGFKNVAGTLFIGSYNQTINLWLGQCYRATYQISGTTVFDADFTAQAIGAASFTAGSGQVVTINGTVAKIVDGTTFGFLPGGSTAHSFTTPDSAALDIQGVEGTKFLALPGVTSNNATVPDSAALDLTTEADIQVRIAFDDWTPAVLNRIVWKGTTSGLNHAYGFNLNTTGTLSWQIGATAGVIAGSSVATGFTDGATRWIRVTWRASDGRVQFFTAADVGSVPVSWTQLGTDQTASLASLNNSTAALCIGEQATGGGNTVAGKVYRVRVLSTIGGTAVLDADFTQQAIGATSFTATVGGTVTVNGTVAKIVDGTTGLFLPGVSGSYASTPDSAALDITGDIDIRAQLALNDWTPSANQTIYAKWTTAGDQRGITFLVTTSGTLAAVWSADGINALSAGSTAALSTPDGTTTWVRMTLDVNNGAGGRSITFFTSTDGVTWTQLGAVVTQAGTTSIFANTALGEIGTSSSGFAEPLNGRVFRVQVLNGIGGTVVFDADFTTQIQFASTFNERSSNAALVTMNGAARLERDRDLEIVMRVGLPDWTPASTSGLVAKWDPGTVSYTLALASGGDLRFLWSTNGTNSLAIASAAAPFTDGVAYWLRVTFDVNNGSGGRTTRFFWAADQVTEPTAWTQIGSDVIATGITSIFPGSSQLAVGVTPAASWFTAGRFYRAIVRNGIGGAVVFDADFADQIQFVSSFREQSSNAALVTLNGQARIERERDLDVRAQVALDDWTPGSTKTFLGKLSADRSWYFGNNGSGNLFLATSPDGTAGLQISAGSSIPIPVTDGSLVWVRATLDVNNGSGARVYQFFTSVDGVSWTQLGTTQTVSGPTSIFPGTSPLEVGSLSGGTDQFQRSRYLRAQVLNGINGPTVFDADFSRLPPFTTSFAESSSSTATVSVNGFARVERDRDLDVRMRVALDSWTPASPLLISRWYGPSRYVFYVAVTSGGLLQIGESSTGTAAGFLFTNSTAPTGLADGAVKWIRVTHDMNDGTGNNVITFWLSDDGATWTPLGTPVSRSGPWSLDPVTNVPLEIGGEAGGLFNLPAGNVYRVQFLNGIGGAPIVDLDFTASITTGNETVLDLTDPGPPVIPASTQTAPNLGWGGAALNAMYGSTTSADTNDPLLLEHTGTNYLYLSGVTGNFASVPDSAALDITGDLELVLRMSLDDWTPASEQYPFAKRGGASQRSWMWAATTGGLMRLYYSTDGSTESIATSTTVVPFTDGQAGWLKITLDVDNGAGGRDVKFFTAADQATEPTTFTQLGTTITTAGTISLFNSTSVVSVGAYADGGFTSGKFYRAIVRNGIGGTTVLDVDFTTGITSGGQVQIHADGPGAPVIPTAADIAINLGTGGAVLDARYGSAVGSDTNDPLLLEHTGTNYLYLPGVSGNYASVPDSAALDITGDIDIRVRVALDDWTPSATSGLINSYPFDAQARWAFFVMTTGNLRLEWWQADGTNRVVTSTVAAGIADGTIKWVRATLDVNNGAAGSDVAFWQSDDGTTWTQVGTTVTGAYTTDIRATTAAVIIGGLNVGASNLPAGKFYRAQIRNGIGGTVVLDADFTSGITSGGQTSFVESSSNAATVTINRSTSGRKSAAVVRPIWLLGTDDYFEVADNDLLDFGTTQDFTVAIVARRWGTQASNTMLIAKKSGTSAANVGWQLVSNSGGRDYIQVSDGTAQNFDLAPAFTLGQQQVIGAVRVGTGTKTLNTYLNSSSDGTSSDSTTATLANSEAMRIGRLSGAGTNYADMELLAALVFRRALSASELQDIETHYTSAPTATSNALMAGSVLWIDAGRQRALTINRSTSGRKSVAVVQPVWLLGTDDFFQVSDNDLLDFGATDSFTVVAVVRQWGTQTAFSRFMSKRSTVGYTLNIGTVGNAQFYVQGASGSGEANVTLTNGVLSCIAGVRNAGTALVSVNGSTGSATDTSTSLANALNYRIGADPGGGNAGSFELLAALVFRRALSATELAAITDHYVNNVVTTSTVALLSGSVFWVDASQRAVAQINRSTTGRKSVAVVEDTWLLGTDDYFEVATSPSLSFADGESFTILSVLRGWEIQGLSATLLARSSSLTPSEAGYALSTGATSGNRASLRAGDGSGGGSVNGTTERTPGDRYAVWAQYDGSTHQLSVAVNNGAPTIATGPALAALANLLPLRIGRLSGAGTQYLDAEVRATALWRRMLSAQEIAAVNAFYGTT